MRPFVITGIGRVYKGSVVIEVGKVNHLLVFRETDSGYYLKSLDGDDEVFMPPALADQEITLDETIDVFVYHDPNNSILATTEIPYAEVGEFALLTSVQVTDFGAFFSWGISKDLLVPGNEQKIKIREDEEHIVRICLEAETSRVYGTTKLGQYIVKDEIDLEIKQEVDILVARKTDLGYRVIIDKKFIGMIYDNEIFQSVYPGDNLRAVVKKIRDDGLVDLSLQSLGIKNLTAATHKIIEALKINNGKLNLGDKSLPESIKSELNMSKKTFKSAIGMLYKERKVLINKDSIQLLEKEE